MRTYFGGGQGNAVAIRTREGFWHVDRDELTLTVMGMKKVGVLMSERG